MTQEYPLAWPQGWPRSTSRKTGQFNTSGRAVTMTTAERRVHDELRRLNPNKRYKLLVISSNMIRDRQPQDPGVAVYFELEGKPPRVIAVDIYNRVEDNCAAIAATIEAMRAIERHGGATILERAFTGFTALPPPPNAQLEEDAFAILGLERGKAGIEEVRAAHRELVKDAHPDKGGSDAAVSRINTARDRALAELGSKR